MYGIFSTLFPQWNCLFPSTGWPSFFFFGCWFGTLSAPHTSSCHSIFKNRVSVLVAIRLSHLTEKLFRVQRRYSMSLLKYNLDKQHCFFHIKFWVVVERINSDLLICLKFGPTITLINHFRKLRIARQTSVGWIRVVSFVPQSWKSNAKFNSANRNYSKVFTFRCSQWCVIFSVQFGP